MISKKDFKALLPDDQVSICVGFGLFGFVLSVFLLAIGGKQVHDGINYTPYGEIKIENKRDLIVELIHNRMECLSDSLSSALKNTLTLPTEGSERESFNLSLTVLKSALKNAIKELDSVRHSTVDTSITEFGRYIFPDKKAYLDSINSKWNKNGQQVKLVKVTLIDTCRLINIKGTNSPRLLLERKLELKQNKRTTRMGFIRDYPQFGLWIVLSIAQMMMWFILFPLLAGNVLMLKDKWQLTFKDISLIDPIVKSMLPLFVIGVFCLLFYGCLVDGDVINDGYFLTNYNVLLIVYGLFGYLAATFCFGTFLSLASHVTVLDNNSRSKLRKDDADLNAQFLALKSAFDNSFLASALILSFYVLWAGVAINAINHTEAFKFYEVMTGKPLIPNDLVYLMGIMHTCILLLFYLPVKLKFNSLTITKEPTTDDAGNSTKKVISTLGESLLTILVTASPLIASFVQKIIEALGE